MLAHAEPAADVLTNFEAWLNPIATLVAHNALFDVRILAGEAPSIVGNLPNMVIDTLPIARTMGVFPNNKLDTIGNCLCPEISGYHRSEMDTKVVIKLFLHAIKCQVDVVYPELFRGRSLSSVLNCTR